MNVCTRTRRGTQLFSTVLTPLHFDNRTPRVPLSFALMRAIAAIPSPATFTTTMKGLK